MTASLHSPLFLGATPCLRGEGPFSPPQSSGPHSVSSLFFPPPPRSKRRTILDDCHNARNGDHSPANASRNSPSTNCTAISRQSRKIQSAAAARSSAAAIVVVNPITRAPAAFPERTPAAVSSTTRQSPGANPSRAAAFKYGSGSGFPIFTSLPVIIELGIGKPAARRRTVAKGRVPEVAIVHRSFGSVCSNCSEPSSGTTPSKSSISRRSTSRSSQSISEFGNRSLIVARLGRPCAIFTTFSGSNPRSSAHRRHTRETAGVESISTPSRSNNNPRQEISAMSPYEIVSSKM